MGVVKEAMPDHPSGVPMVSIGSFPWMTRAAGATPEQASSKSTVKNADERSWLGLMIGVGRSANSAGEEIQAAEAETSIYASCQLRSTRSTWKPDSSAQQFYSHGSADHWHIYSFLRWVQSAARTPNPDRLLCVPRHLTSKKPLSFLGFRKRVLWNLSPGRTLAGETAGGCTLFPSAICYIAQ